MRTYPAKLLLFGEHILLTGSTALALPVPAFAGKWKENSRDIKAQLQRKLLLFAESEQLAKVNGLDAEAFYHDLQNGLVFDSNIPIGYGLGSSGALCAGVYDRYVALKTDDPVALKAILSGMECFFHGSSSGIDPLTSYVNAPLLIRHKTEVERVVQQPWKQAPIVFLIDSELPRKTGPLVRWFLESCETPVFSEKLQRDYLPAHEAVLRSWLDADADVFWPNLRQVSRFQLENFHPMIPDTLREVWERNIESQQITFKICGAGGGGFMLGFSEHIDAVRGLSERFNLVFPFDP